MSPLYDFQCSCGQVDERFFTIEGCPDAYTCSRCGGMAEKVLSIGGIQMSAPSWINDQVRGCLQSEDDIRNKVEKPIETRQELAAHLKKNNLEPADG